jgi:hypothetical protein
MTKKIALKKFVRLLSSNVTHKVYVYQKSGSVTEMMIALIGKLAVVLDFYNSMLLSFRLNNFSKRQSYHFSSFSSDEQNCEHKQCSINEFRCPNGRCIPFSWTCDSDKDCPDGSDEGKKASCHMLPQSNSCDPTYFK